MGIHLVELPHLAVGTPSQIAAASFLQIHPSNPIETARSVKPRCEFIGDTFVLNKPVLACEMDCLLVQKFRLELVPLDASDLRLYQRGMTPEIFLALRRQHAELLTMSS